MAYCQPYQLTWSKAPYYTCSRCASFSSDSLLLHAPILFYREKERNVWASCLLFGVTSDGFNHSWVPCSSGATPSLPPPLFFYCSHFFCSRALSKTGIPSCPTSTILLSCLQSACLFLWVCHLHLRLNDSATFCCFDQTVPSCWDSGACVLSVFCLFFLFLTWMHFYFCVSHSSTPLYVYRCVPGLQYWPGTEWTNIIDIISTPGTKQGFWRSFQRHCVSNVDFCFCL